MSKIFNIESYMTFWNTLIHYIDFTSLSRAFLVCGTDPCVYTPIHHNTTLKGQALEQTEGSTAQRGARTTATRLTLVVKLEREAAFSTTRTQNNVGFEAVRRLFSEAVCRGCCWADASAAAGLLSHFDAPRCAAATTTPTCAVCRLLPHLPPPMMPSATRRRESWCSFDSCFYGHKNCG